MTTNDDPDARREAPAPRAVDPLREALEAAIADTEADLIADEDAEERVDLHVYAVSLPLETARNIRAALAAAPQPEDIEAKIYAFLREYRQEEVHDEDGYGYPLVDALTLDGHGIDMGEREIYNLAREIAHMLGAPAPQPAPVDREKLVEVIRTANPDVLRENAKVIADALLAAGLRLPGTVQPAPVERETLVGVICLANEHWCDQSDGRKSRFEAIADALLAAGLRLPGVVQPDETMAWAIVGEDGLLKHVTGNGRNLAKQWAGPSDSVVRVAIRRMEDET